MDKEISDFIIKAGDNDKKQLIEILSQYDGMEKLIKLICENE
jgi:hypothetical protein